MKNKDMLIKALNTLFYSWGGDTPAEVFWGANELIEWIEKEFNVNIGAFIEDENGENNFNDTIKIISNL